MRDGIFIQTLYDLNQEIEIRLFINARSLLSTKKVDA